jgi:exopolyphosphatase/guanosine-5'-triphosphate,3'-diphosphate pyrophosphatase
MEKRFAVMDLGTNTFHLLIVEGNMKNFREIAHEHVAVKLGEGGINKGIILPAPFERGVETLKQFRKKIDSNHVQLVRAIATSALRNAANGNVFVDKVKEATGIVIEIIDGDSEASFIYQGVKASGALSASSSLIMDIGGGSVEFIIGNTNQFVWKQSFEIGAARLMDKFHHSDPISPASIEAVDLYLENALADLFEATQKYTIDNLIGSSGAFETFAELIETQTSDAFDLKNITNYDFDEAQLLAITDKLVLSTHAERAANNHIIPVRVDMIVVASLITRFIMQRLDITKVALCTYSLKEGVLAEMMTQ